MRWLGRAAVLVSACVLALACSPGYIGDTPIEDTPDKRAVFEVVEAYRQAIEHRSVETLAAIVSPQYFENASSTAIQLDDYGYEKLRDVVMPLLQDHIKSVQYRIRMIRLEVEGDRAFADFEYWVKFLYTEGGRDGWRTKNDFNRLEFAREGGAWKIIGGL